MSVPLILTLPRARYTFIGALRSWPKPSNRVLVFCRAFAAGIMLLISLMESCPPRLIPRDVARTGLRNVYYRPVSYFGLDRLLPHAHHPQDLVQKAVAAFPGSIKRTAILLTLGIPARNFPEGSPPCHCQQQS